MSGIASQTATTATIAPTTPHVDRSVALWSIFGFWAFSVLRRPQVKAGFEARMAEIY